MSDKVESAPADPNSDSRPSLEELLRLKRAEQPDPSFWAKFDRELERGIVQSVVRRRPLPERVITFLGRPAGALAGLFLVAALAGVLLTETSSPLSLPTAEAGSKSWVPVAAVEDTGADRQDFVIEVFASGAALDRAQGGGEEWRSGDAGEVRQAVYVAESLGPEGTADRSGSRVLF
jgi:hypothetical protein